MFARFHSNTSLKNILLQSCRRLHKKAQKPSFAPVDEVGTVGQRNFRLLLKPLGFTVLVTSVSYGGCLIWYYENVRARQRNMQSPFSGGSNYKAGTLRQRANHIHNQLSPMMKTVISIISINTAVFLLWRLKPLQPVMTKWFCSSPFSGARCSSMLLSAFSHYALFHLSINMYVLWSFAPPITLVLGKEQFVAFYLSTAVVSSLASYAVKVARMSLVPSLGASGAILGMIALFCTYFPEKQLSIALVDQIIPHSFSAGNAIKGIILIDFVCLVAGFRLFDHAAHLGGALFGLWYAKYGRRVLRKPRERFLREWDNLRRKK